MKKMNVIISQVDEMIAKLSLPLSQQDMACGWRDKSKEAMLKFFMTMLQDIKKKPPQIKVEYMTLARGLDAWGIEDGILAEMAYKISSDLIDYEKEHRNFFT